MVCVYGGPPWEGPTQLDQPARRFFLADNRPLPFQPHPMAGSLYVFFPLVVPAGSVQESYPIGIITCCPLLTQPLQEFHKISYFFLEIVLIHPLPKPPQRESGLFLPLPPLGPG